MPPPRAAVAELDKQLGSIERRFAFGDGACGDIEPLDAAAFEAALARWVGAERRPTCSVARCASPGAAAR